VHAIHLKKCAKDLKKIRLDFCLEICARFQWYDLNSMTSLVEKTLFNFCAKLQYQQYGPVRIYPAINAPQNLCKRSISISMHFLCCTTNIKCCISCYEICIVLILNATTNILGMCPNPPLMLLFFFQLNLSWKVRLFTFLTTSP
jgi:hypothetical protein